MHHHTKVYGALLIEQERCALIGNVVGVEELEDEDQDVFLSPTSVMAIASQLAVGLPGSSQGQQDNSGGGVMQVGSDVASGSVMDITAQQPTPYQTQESLQILQVNS